MPSTILVIDDEQDVWKTLSFRFEALGFEIVSAVDGKQGIEKAKTLKPSLILLDFGLPNQTGLEVLKLLKKPSPDNIHQIPVIMLTGHDEFEQECLEAGASGYLTKPFDLFQLKETLSKFLPR